jgi:hypothetical protein
VVNRWFCTDFKEIIDTSGTSPRAQMLSEKWKENKRKERKERKELKINAPPLKQRPRLPPSLDGVRTQTQLGFTGFVESDVVCALSV